MRINIGSNGDVFWKIIINAKTVNSFVADTSISLYFPPLKFSSPPINNLLLPNTLLFNCPNPNYIQTPSNTQITPPAPAAVSPSSTDAYTTPPQPPQPLQRPNCHTPSSHSHCLRSSSCRPRPRTGAADVLKLIVRVTVGAEGPL